MKILFAAVMLSTFVSLVFAVTKNETVNFFNCIACAKEDQGRLDYMGCSDMKPTKVHEIDVLCMKEILPFATSISDLWPRLCKRRDIVGQLYDCVLAREKQVKFTSMDKQMMKEFLGCALAVKQTYCYYSIISNQN